MLQAAASATTTLRIGSNVFSNDFWHPVPLAREAATLDVLSGGRFELGIGAGYFAGSMRRRVFLLPARKNALLAWKRLSR